MEAVALSTLFSEWTPLILAIYTFVVTAASILLKVVMTFVKKRQELEPSYEMGTFIIVLISLLTALSHNSKSAAEIRK
jgi:hypothetical protein